jgi:hypothetical protein
MVAVGFPSTHFDWHRTVCPQVSVTPWRLECEPTETHRGNESANGRSLRVRLFWFGEELLGGFEYAFRSFDDVLMANEPMQHRTHTISFLLWP